MKNRLHSAFRSVVDWFGSARRAQPQECISPEQLRKALTEMLADPQTRRLVLGHALGTAFPIEGGVTSGTPGRIAKFAANGTDLEDSIVHQSGDNITGKVGIATTAPVRKLDVHETGINVVAARLAGLGTPPDYSRNVALSFHPRVDFLVNDGARIEAQLTSGVSGSEYADLALQTRAAGVLSTKMLIEAGGNVGIGTTPGPGVRLDVAGGGVRSQGSAGGNHAFLGSFVNGTFSNWLGTGLSADFYNLLGGPDQAGGFGVAQGDSIISPIVWMYSYGGRNMFDVRSVGFQQNPTAGTSLFTVRESGNVGIGTTDRLSKLTVKGSPSFVAAGTVSTAVNSPTVSGVGTMFARQVGLGDRITIGTETKTVKAIASDTSLTADSNFANPNSGASMTVRPSLFRCDASSGNRQLMVDDDGFVGLAGTAVNDNDGVGYVICNADKTFSNLNNEMRGYQATMRYTRDNSADANVVYNIKVDTSGTAVTWREGPQFITTGAWNNVRIDITDINGVTSSYVIQSVTDATHLTLTASAGTQSNRPAAVWQTSRTALTGSGWDVLGHVGAVSLQSMNLPPTDTEIRGQMKPFQSELRFEAATGPSPTPRYEVVGPAQNYVGALFKVHSSCTITQWAGYVVGVPCPEGGAADKVTTGYGVWVKNLDDPAHTLVKAKAAAIKLDGLEEYGRILWTNCSAYCPISGVLELHATTAVQTASGVPFNVGGSGGNAICNAGGYRVGGAAPSGNYLRGNGTNFVSSAIQAADVPNLDASKITTGVLATARIPDLDASKITSGQFADARMPTDVVTSQDGAAHKIAAGSVLVSAGGSATVSTGLSAITGFGVEHVWTVAQFVQHAATVSGGSITIYNDGANNEYFSWIAFGTA